MSSHGNRHRTNFEQVLFPKGFPQQDSTWIPEVDLMARAGKTRRLFRGKLED